MFYFFAKSFRCNNNLCIPDEDIHSYSLVYSLLCIHLFLLILIFLYYYHCLPHLKRVNEKYEKIIFKKKKYAII